MRMRELVWLRCVPVPVYLCASCKAWMRRAGVVPASLCEVWMRCGCADSWCGVYMVLASLCKVWMRMRRAGVVPALLCNKV